MKQYLSAFTLIELLVAMSIMAILATVGLVSFRSSQIKSRDAQRKSDLKQIANSLEMFLGDHKCYPSSNNDGLIKACPYSSGYCQWGEGEFTDGQTIYFKKLPVDPAGFDYRYRALNENQSYQLYAHLENTEDKSLIVTAYNCGEERCNFAVTSTDVSVAE